MQRNATAARDLEQIRSNTPLPDTYGDLRPSHLTLAVFGLSRRKSIYFTILNRSARLFGMRVKRLSFAPAAGIQDAGLRGSFHSLRRVSPLQFRQFISSRSACRLRQSNCLQLWRVDSLRGMEESIYFFSIF
jgi:hypothetical protein